MPPKNKPKAKVNHLTSEELKKLQGLKEHLQEQKGEHIAHLNAQCESTCDQIYKSYDDHLKVIPEDKRNMTIKEFMEAQQQQKTEPECDELESVKESLKSNIEHHKTILGKKKILRLTRLEKNQRKVIPIGSASTSGSVKSKPGILSESDLHTPSPKKSVARAIAVTPKLKPKSAMSKILLRKPRTREAIRSQSVNPLHSIMDEIAGKPEVTVSLGCGKAVNLMAEKEIEKLKKDDDTKAILEGAEQKLDDILKSD